MEIITDSNGATAGIQNSFLFFLPCLYQEIRSEQKNINRRETTMDGLKTYNELTDEEEDQERYTNEYCLPIPLQAMTNVWGYRESERNWAENRSIITPWWAELKTDWRTATILVFLVNFLIPRNPLSCWRAMVMAAPPMNPTTAAWDKKSIKKPNLKKL